MNIGEARGRGRPRSAEIDEAVLEATLRALGDPGFAALTIEAIAAEAHVGRGALYRRWPDKAALATAALERLRERRPDQVTGDTRADLVAALERYAHFYGELRGFAMVGALMAAEEDHPELVARFRERVVHPRRAHIRGLLERGRDAGELRADLDLDVAVAALVGAFYARALAGESLPPGWSEAVVDGLWPALAPGC